MAQEMNAPETILDIAMGCDRLAELAEQLRVQARLSPAHTAMISSRNPVRPPDGGGAPDSRDRDRTAGFDPFEPFVAGG